jgi:hypothetical protein
MFDIKLINNGNILTAEITSKEQSVEYAFYIIKDGITITTQWYSNSPSFCYDCNNEAGVYSTTGFLKKADGQILMKSSKWVVIHGTPLLIDSLAELDLNGPSLIRSNELDIPILIKVKKEKRLFVLLSGAIDRSTQNPPIFHRWTWHEKFPGTVLAISDPTLNLDPEIGLGWYIGSKHNDATEAVAEIIRQVAQKQEIPLENVIMYGSSGGGFAALMITAKLGQGIAVAINCQINALHYLDDAVKTMLRVSFNNIDKQEVQETYPNRISVLENWKISQNTAHAILIQNKGDTFHYEHHYKKFAEFLNLNLTESSLSKDGRHRAIIYDDESGHGAEPEKLVEEIINYAVQYTK